MKKIKKQHTIIQPYIFEVCDEEVGLYSRIGRVLERRRKKTIPTTVNIDQRGRITFIGKVGLERYLSLPDARKLHKFLGAHIESKKRKGGAHAIPV